MNELLPIGSVVTTKTSKRMLTIIGYLPLNTETNTFYDYFCTSSKLGLNKSEEKTKKDRDVFNLNHNDIEDVLFMGYISKEFYLYKECFSTIKNKYENGLTELTDEKIKEIVEEMKKKIKGDDNHEE